MSHHLVKILLFINHSMDFGYFRMPIPLRKQTYVTENVTDVFGKVRRWNGPGQGTSTEYEITDGHRVSPPGHPTKGNYLEEARRDDGETN